MIHIKTNNLFFKTALQEQFSSPDVSLTIAVEEGRLSITDGVETKTYALPVKLADVQKDIDALTCKNQITCFENNDFIFSAPHRNLTEKKTGKINLLTEKETQLICFLVQHVDRSVPKEALLLHVWDYHPDVQTHTVESHIYALRQKISEDAEAFIHTTPDGYMIKSDS